MSQDKLPTELQFRKGDTAKIIGLESNKDYNGKLATITGSYSKVNDKWPVQINLGYGKLQILMNHNNLIIHEYGNGWVIDCSAPIQRLNLLLKAYIRDLEAFAKLTRRETRIFNDDFIYEMHDNIVCDGLTQFDKELSKIKQSIVQSIDDENENIERYLIDKTQVLVLDDTLKRFHAIVTIKIGNNKLWKRISEIHIDEQTNLIKLAKVISIDIVDDETELNTDNNDDDDNKYDDMQGIVNVFNAKSEEKEKDRDK